MTTVGAYELKTHTGQFLDRMERGEIIAITRRGKRIGYLSPDPARKHPKDFRTALRKLKILRKGVRLGKGVTIKQLIEEGRM